MNIFLLTLTASLAGGLGAVARYLLDSFLPGKAYFKTLIINASGSFLAGLAIGLVMIVLPSFLSVAISAGFLGGFTTFSASSLQLALLIKDRKSGAAVFIALVQLLVSVLLFWLGLWISAL